LLLTEEVDEVPVGRKEERPKKSGNPKNGTEKIQSKVLYF